MSPQILCRSLGPKPPMTARSGSPHSLSCTSRSSDGSRPSSPRPQRLPATRASRLTRIPVHHRTWVIAGSMPVAIRMSSARAAAGPAPRRPGTAEFGVFFRRARPSPAEVLLFPPTEARQRLQVRGRRKRVTETALPARLARAVHYSGKKEGGSMGRVSGAHRGPDGAGSATIPGCRPGATAH